MKAKLKGIFAATAITTAGFCFGISSAVAGVGDNTDNNLVVVNKLTSVSTIDAFGTTRSVFTTEAFAQMFDKPLVRIPLDQKALSVSKKSASKKMSKTNEFFALATVLKR